MIRRDVAIWTPPGRKPSTQTLSLAEAARIRGVAAALAIPDHSGRRIAHVHGERYDLWWEFSLAHSFRWQAHVNGQEPESYRQRVADLCHALNLTDLLSLRGEELTPAERARANLAAALLSRPNLLIWEEPFRLLDGADRVAACQLLRVLGALEGLTVIAVSAESPGLREEVPHDRQFPTRISRSDRRGGTGSAGRRAAAGGTGA